MKVETRNIRGTELRAAADFVLEGVAAAYNVPSQDLGGFTEIISPGAFTQSLKAGDDVVCTHNHDVNRVLGRRKSGTLTLEDKAQGLTFRCQLDPKNSVHCDVYASVKRGDTSECSFAFRVLKDGESWSADGKQRTLRSVQLVDVSAVTFPAYKAGTSVDARAASYSLDRAQAATLLAVRSKATALGIRIQAEEDADRRKRAAQLGKVIANDAARGDAEEKKDSELRARMEVAAGRICRTRRGK